MELKIISAIEEQISVQFTGKVNILSNFNRQYLGHLTFQSGEMTKASFQGLTGLKAFYQIVVQEYSLNSFTYVVEPEIIEDVERDLFVPYAILKKKIPEVVTLYKESLKLRPPENVRIVVDPEFMESKHALSSEEFKVLLTLTEWSSPFDIYQHCSLLDHEITLALVGLRKKEALKIISNRTN